MSSLLQAELLLDALCGTFLEIFTVHWQDRGLAVQRNPEMRAFGGFEGRSQTAQPPLELAALHGLQV